MRKLKTVNLALLVIWLAGLMAGCQKQLFIPLMQKNSIVSTIATPPPGVLATSPRKTEEIPHGDQGTQAVPTLLPTATRVVLLHLPYLLKSAPQTARNWQIMPRSLLGNKEGGFFTLELRYPEIIGAGEQSVKGFNDVIQEWLNKESEHFLTMVEESPAETQNGFLVSSYIFPSSPGWKPTQLERPFPNNPTTLTPDQALLDLGTPIISLIFQTSEYVGGEHSLEQHTTFNYDLRNGRILSLADLFKPGEDFLAIISQYCANELYANNRLQVNLIRRNTAPLLDNYQIWNLTPQGLLITFEEYRVGPYSAGPQHVLIPYDIFKRIINKQGPLKNLANSG